MIQIIKRLLKEREAYETTPVNFSVDYTDLSTNGKASKKSTDQYEKYLIELTEMGALTYERHDHSFYIELDGDGLKKLEELIR
jgi:hypothetical protein